MADLQRRDLERLIAQSLLTAETFAADTRRRLRRAVLRGEPTGPILEDFQIVLGELGAEAEIAATIEGLQAMQLRLPEQAALAEVIEGFEPFGTPDPILRLPATEAAAEDLLSRQILTRPQFDQLTREARGRAFTVAGEQSADAIATIRDVLAEQLDTGISKAAFDAELEDRLLSSKLGPAHQETVFRTNAQSAFSRGQEALHDDPIVEALFPYAAYNPIIDGRVRDEHLALGAKSDENGGPLGLDGTNIYRADDPMWQFFTPPWDYNCRCGKTFLTLEQAARRGVKEAQRWLETGEPPAVPEYRIDVIGFRPDPQFASGALVA